jgi:hypothetical protein
MKIFVSWSGERSKALAFALRDWLPLVLHYADPWLSEADIDAGTRWADAVAKQLESCNFGIICITRENLASPWILFESGALAKSLEGSRVIPLLLDLDFREISGPLAQFQAKKVEKNGLMEIVDSINKTAAHAVPEDRYRQLFDALWNDLETKVGAIPKISTPTKQTRPQSEVLEELVGAVRAIESRVRDGVEEPRAMRRKSKNHPMLLTELGKMLSEKPGDPINILVFASALRDDIPWLYELGIEAYRQAVAGRSASSRSAMKRFSRAVELTMHGPFFIEELGIDPRMHHRILREITHALEYEQDEAAASKSRKLDGSEAG